MEKGDRSISSNERKSEIDAYQSPQQPSKWSNEKMVKQLQAQKDKKEKDANENDRRIELINRIRHLSDKGKQCN